MKRYESLVGWNVSEIQFTLGVKSEVLALTEVPNVVTLIVDAEGTVVQAHEGQLVPYVVAPVIDAPTDVAYLTRELSPEERQQIADAPHKRDTGYQCDAVDLQDTALYNLSDNACLSCFGSGTEFGGFTCDRCSGTGVCKPSK